MPLTLEELKEIISERIDPDELVELLEIHTEELLEYFEDKLIEKRNKFKFIEEDYDNAN